MARIKFNKFLNKRCPECGSRLQSINRIEYKDGVEFTEQLIECVECDYHKEVKNNHHNIPVKDWQ